MSSLAVGLLSQFGDLTRTGGEPRPPREGMEPLYSYKRRVGVFSFYFVLLVTYLL